MTDDQFIALVTSDNDQYLAEARRWVEESDFGHVMELWAWLQQEFADKNMDIASRLAACTLAPLIAETWAARRSPPAE